MNPAANHNYAICYTARQGYDKLVALLLADSRVDPADQDNEALYNAAYGRHDKIVDLLLADARVNPSIAAKGYIKVVTRMESFFRNL